MEPDIRKLLGKLREPAIVRYLADLAALKERGVMVWTKCNARSLRSMLREARRQSPDPTIRQMRIRWHTPDPYTLQAEVDHAPVVSTQLLFTKRNLRLVLDGFAVLRQVAQAVAEANAAPPDLRATADQMAMSEDLLSNYEVEMIRRAILEPASYSYDAAIALRDSLVDQYRDSNSRLVGRTDGG